MAHVKIYDIALNEGFCPECLFEALAELNIDTFSSVEVLKAKVSASVKMGTIPASYKHSWVYFCEEHDAEYDDSQSCTHHDETIEILDVL